MQDQANFEHLQMRRLRIVALVEGLTLLVLIGVAVPLKHLAGMPQAVSIIGPIHGITFVLYNWMAATVVSTEDWSRQDIMRVVLAAVLPFGTFLNAGFMRRKEASLIHRGSRRGSPAVELSR